MDIQIIFRGIERIIVTMTAPLLIYFGYKLFLKGITGEMEIAAEKDTLKGKLTNVAPGSLCFILGVSLGAYVMFSKVETTRFIQSTPIEKKDGMGKQETQDEAEEQGKINNKNKRKPNNPSKDREVYYSQFIGGHSQEAPPSSILLKIYGQFGIKVQDLIATGKIENNEIQHLIEDEVLTKVNRSITYTQFRDLMEIEKKAAEGDLQSVDQIRAYRNDYILKK
ncbi:MAG: hypothetical protein KGZ62_05445 [Sulfurimonas sp.]|nr:hypothetical protein [Sulfurimonas sp.]